MGHGTAPACVLHSPDIFCTTYDPLPCSACSRTSGSNAYTTAPAHAHACAWCKWVGRMRAGASGQRRAQHRACARVGTHPSFKPHIISFHFTSYRITLNTCFTSLACGQACGPAPVSQRMQTRKLHVGRVRPVASACIWCMRACMRKKGRKGKKKGKMSSQSHIVLYLPRHQHAQGAVQT